MKITLIICMVIAIFDSVKSRNSDITIKSKTEHKDVYKTNTLPRGKTENLPTMKENVTSLPILSIHSTTNELSVKKRLMPKMAVKDLSTENNKSSYVLTTRRPLMINRKFTSKPHAVHYIHSRTHGEQNNFSKRRNLSAKKQFNSQTKNKNILNTSKNLDSGEDRFINFTDIGAIDDYGQSKRRGYTHRQLNRRQGYPLATAASQQFKSIAINTLNTDKVRTKSKLAIQESLIKIRRIRPGLTERVITTTESVSTQIKNNRSLFTIKKTEDNRSNILKTLRKSINTTENSATTAETLVKSANTTENSNDSVSLSETDIKPLTNIEKLHSLTKTENPFYSRITENLDNSTIKTEKADFPANTVDNLVDNETEKLFISATTNENLNNTVFNTEKSIHSTTTTEKSDYYVFKTVKRIHPADVIETSDKSVSETITLVPLIIVTGKSFSLFDVNDTVKVSNDNIVTLKDLDDPKKLMVKEEENIITVTPIHNKDEVTTTETMTQDKALRSKRRINIIEEERVATTSTGFRFSERKTPLSIDFTYKNIHV